MDSGIKLLVLLILGIAPFFISCHMSYMLLLAYLIALTHFLRIQLSVIFKNTVAYVIIIILPYIFGFLVAILVSSVTGNDLTKLYSSLEDVSLRLFQLFILWYAGILYLNSTKIESIIGLFDKLLSPLKRFGVPVADFLKIIMCVIQELKELAPEVKKGFTESFSSIFGNRKSLPKSKLAGISQIIVNYFVNSFERLGKVEEYVKNVEDRDLFHYKFTISLHDVFLVVSIITLVVSIILVSNSFCPV